MDTRTGQHWFVSRVRGRGLVPGTHGKGGAGVHALADGIAPVCKTHTVLLERTAHTGCAFWRALRRVRRKNETCPIALAFNLANRTPTVGSLPWHCARLFPRSSDRF